MTDRAILEASGDYNISSQRIMNAAMMTAELEAMKAENRQRELEGKSLAFGYDEFIEVQRKWSY